MEFITSIEFVSALTLMVKYIVFGLMFIPIVSLLLGNKSALKADFVLFTLGIETNEDRQFMFMFSINS